MKRLVVGSLVVAALAALAGEAGGTSATTNGSWAGTYSLGGPGHISLTISGKRAFVALGVGHADLQSVPLTTAGTRIHLQLPGRPAPVVFDGTAAGAWLKKQGLGR